MRHNLNLLIGVMVLLFSVNTALASSALSVLGRDYTFTNSMEGFPKTLSEFSDLKINTFKTSDGVELTYWEAGSGEPLVFIPGWSANGAEYFNVMYLLKQRYHVYVLDQRNQGLSQRVDFGMRISRFATDLKEFADHAGLQKANYCGWSMGASVLWSYIDMFGTISINKVVFIDESPSIYCHRDWSEKERLNFGGLTTSPERMIASFTNSEPTNQLIMRSHLYERFTAMDSPYFENTEKFAQEFIKNDARSLSLILFDHVTNDWRDVIQTKIDIPTAIFTGEYSDSLDAQRWIHSVIRDSKLYVYSKEEQGDHFLAFKNPKKFAADIISFLNQ
jgi:pimeloyl-ACP methyl ester carboxylesterase